MKITHMWRRWGAHLRISLCHLLMNFEKHKKSDFWKNEKKFTGDPIILHICTKNHNHMRYSSWDMEWDTFFCHFGSFYNCISQMTIIWCMVPEILSNTDMIFCQFGLFFAFSPPLTTQKIKILKKWKKLLVIIILHMSIINKNHMMYDSWDMECVR